MNHYIGRINFLPFHDFIYILFIKLIGIFKQKAI